MLAVCIDETSFCSLYCNANCPCRSGIERNLECSSDALLCMCIFVHNCSMSECSVLHVSGWYSAAPLILLECSQTAF